MAVYEVMATVLPVVGALNVTVAAPLLNALFVPTSTAETPVGASGAIKLSCADDLIPLPLVAIFSPYSSILNIYYADKSPITTQVSVALLNRVADDHCARNFKPGVAFTVTPAAPATVTWPAPV